MRFHVDVERNTLGQLYAVRIRDETELAVASVNIYAMPEPEMLHMAGLIADALSATWLPLAEYTAAKERLRQEEARREQNGHGG